MGHLLLSTPLHVPRGGPQSGVAQDPDAAVIMALRVLPAYTGCGVGRQLVQAAAALVARGPRTFRALEVEASRSDPSCAVPPVEFFERTGFTTCRRGLARRRMRLDLERTARFGELWGEAWGRVVTWARPLPPEPASGRGAVARGVSRET